ncbi:DUF6094 domain-containing protein [Cytobacillus purgationiresistens]|uniref:DUF6094 domain-containing protein n=1 Tax=Cytobacillus purgationiresistens TaxID=863449 RepID=A0ABU0AK33_9BACI|nr:DUF6094 domain-containing protein [Cytobacillus purgationiresistens]MDQ0271234.1 hypothetical protein [Cytobacillus purgationiresistens]
MSHLGNKIKAGYYRTPDLQGEYLKKLLHFTGDTPIFDPTCGEGFILNYLATGHEPRNIKSYGVELDRGRAASAAKIIDRLVQAPIESMVISHNVFGLLLLNPPYDNTIVGIGKEGTERKEFIELARNTKYLIPGGLMIYIIPSYRFADKHISRFLATQFEEVGVAKFSDEDYEDYKQCIFIGRKKVGKKKKYNKIMHEFLLSMESEDFIKTNVSSIKQFIGQKQWEVPEADVEVPTFYSKIENKRDFILSIKENKGFLAFKERTKPKQLEIGGDPIINIAQGQMALLLASGAVNGVLGEGEHLHAVQGVETVSNVETTESTDDMIITKTRTKRDISIKIILPTGKVKKLV